METTEPLDGNNFEAVADSLIMNTPENPDEATEEVVEETVDEQPEAIEADAEGQDDVEMSDDDLDFDIEDVEVEEPEVEQEPLYTVKVDGKEKAGILGRTNTRLFRARVHPKGYGRKRRSP